jgi:hypothetical protein
MTRHQAIDMIVKEIERASEIFPTFPKDRVHMAAIVAEECGELMQATLQQVYEPHKGGNPIKEAVQTAAMAVRFLENYPV